ncbi:MAG: PAS-domain containing protein, partial [Alphaproteobacteria bacterium]
MQNPEARRTVARLDADDRIVWVDRDLARMAPELAAITEPGTPYEAWVRGLAHAGLAPEPRPAAEDWVRDVLSRHRRNQAGFELRLPDGRWIFIDEVRIEDETIACVHMDITETKRQETAASADTSAESKAREARTRLIDAIESIPASFVLFDTSDRLVMWNSKAPEFLHEVRDMLVFGQRYEDLVVGAARSGAIADAAGREDEWIAEQMAWHRRPEGAREIRYTDGRTLQIRERRTGDCSTVSIRTDITEIRRGKEQLAESEQRYRALVEASPDIIMAVSDGRVRFVNSAGALQLGAENTERIIGRPLERFIDDEDVQRARALVSSALDGLAPAFQEMRMRRLDGGALEAEVAAIRFVDRGSPAVQLVVRDVTQRKIAEAQLIQASKLATLGEMAAGLTHELNQPLNIVRMAADASLILMEDGEADLEDHRRQFTRISEQTQRMAGIIDHMRVFSRLDDADGEAFDLVGCLKRSTDLIAEQ